MANNEYDCIVLGVGGFGSAACYWLSRNGKRILGLEQFEFGHDRGSSEDHSRIIRLSYNTPFYVELAKHAYAAWEDLEAESGETLVIRTGGLDFASRDSVTGVQPYANSLTERGVEFELLDADEIMHRWPQFKLDDSMHGIFQADTGIAIANLANNTHRELARARGAELKTNIVVRGLRSIDGEVEVVTDSGSFRAGKLILTAGAWTPQALQWLDVEMPLEITQEQVTYFSPADAAAYQIGRFPVWIYLDDPAFYGFPMFGDGVKAAIDAFGEVVTADTRSMDPNPENKKQLLNFLQHCIPGLPSVEVYTKTCLYTMAPDRHFVIDAIPGHENVFMAIGSGHGFKFASLIGKTLAELAFDRTNTDISHFSANRLILQQADPHRDYRL